jgi:hypothetical protein
MIPASQTPVDIPSPPAFVPQPSATPSTAVSPGQETPRPQVVPIPTSNDQNGPELSAQPLPPVSNNGDADNQPTPNNVNDQPPDITTVVPLTSGSITLTLTKPSPDQIALPSVGGDVTAAIYTTVVPYVATSVLTSGLITLTMTDSANSEQPGEETGAPVASVYTTVLPYTTEVLVTSGLATLTLTGAIGSGVPHSGTGATGGGAAENGLVYTTVVPYTTGYTTLVLTSTPSPGASNTMGVGGYINSGLGSNEDGASASGGDAPQTQTGAASMLGVVDVGGIFGIVLGVLMGF